MRQEGIINSGMMLAQKMTFGLGAFFAGIAIDFAGMDGVTEASQVTAVMMQRLAWVYGPGLMCATLLGSEDACVLENGVGQRRDPLCVFLPSQRS